MIIKNVRKSQWEDTLKQIHTYGSKAPLTKQYDIEVNCNGVEYILKVQPTHGRKIAALLELVIFQGAGKRSA